MDGRKKPGREFDKNKSCRQDDEGHGQKEPLPLSAEKARLRADQAEDEDEEIAR
jgi:hypothetical protein